MYILHKFAYRKNLAMLLYLISVYVLLNNESL